MNSSTWIKFNPDENTRSIEQMVLAPDYISADFSLPDSPETVLAGYAAKITDRYKDAGFFDIENDQIKAWLMQSAGYVKKLMVITPAVGFYISAAGFHTEEYTVDLTMRMLLGGTEVTVYTGYLKTGVPPFLQQQLRKLETIGFRILYRELTPNVDGQKNLILAADINEYVQSGIHELIIPKRAIVTPCAADAAHDNQVSILRAGG